MSKLIFDHKPKSLPKTLKELNSYGNNSAKYKTISFNYTNLVEVISHEELANLGLNELASSLKNAVVRLEFNFKHVDNSQILEEFLKLSELKPNFLLEGGELLTPYYDVVAEREFDQSVCQFSIKNGKMTILV